MTALELAAEDLAGLCRQIPGGDMISLSHWRRAVQVAGYINRANDLYSFVLPFLNPVTGLTRLGTREWIVKPAWKSMQQNVLRWFYQAYVNRLGMHLIELMSGRLAIGAHHYRRLTKRPRMGSSGVLGEELKPLAIVVAGAAGAGKSRLIAMIKEACSGEMNLLKAKVAPLGLEPSLLDRLKDARWIESPGYPPASAAESRRARAQRAAGLAAAAECDLLILVINGCQPGPRQRRRVRPGVGPLVPGAPAARGPAGARRRRPASTGPISAAAGRRPPTERSNHEHSRVAGPGSVRLAPVDAAARLSTITRRSVWVTETPVAVIEHVVPALTPLLLKAERTALLRRLHEVAGRSRVGRLVQQIGQHGKSLWGTLKARGKAGSTPR